MKKTKDQIVFLCHGDLIVKVRIKNVHASEESAKYYWESHTCPVNLFNTSSEAHTVMEVMEGGSFDNDPHGIFHFMGMVTEGEKGAAYIAKDEDDKWMLFKGEPPEGLISDDGKLDKDIRDGKYEYLGITHTGRNWMYEMGFGKRKIWGGLGAVRLYLDKSKKTFLGFAEGIDWGEAGSKAGDGSSPPLESNLDQIVNKINKLWFDEEE